jgi:hypothetical protein
VPSLVAPAGEHDSMRFLEFAASANHRDHHQPRLETSLFFPRVTEGNPPLRDRTRLRDTPDFHVETETI